jgi:NAD(P)-dependent dehydrogenase (short-subunit alcohol dehydrogenase family)
MLERRQGSLVHVTSIAGHFPQGFSGAYSVSKAGLAMLSNGLAAEWGPYGVRSNCVSPCMIRTPMNEPYFKTPGVLEKREAMIPLGRLGAPRDIAEVALFLLSDLAAFVSGQDIVVDGAFGQTLLDLIPRPGFERKDQTLPK